MYTSAIRRVALRAISTRPASFASSQRTFVARTFAAQPSRIQWQPKSLSRTYSTNETASPTDATTTGETVPPESNEAQESPAEAESSSETVQAEPSASEQAQEIREESIATPEAADARSTVNAIGQKAREAASTVADTASSIRSSAGFDRPAKAGFDAASPSKILYIGNLFFEVKAEMLEREFSQYGNVVNSKIVTDANGLSKGFGYIEYDDVESATEAIRNLDQQVFEGRRMAVQFHVRRTRATATRSTEANPPSKTLFIGNMSFQMSDKDLNDLFREVRNVLDVRVAIDRKSGQPRGFAHADFVDVASAEKAKKVLEAKTTYGRQLRVDFSRSSATTRNDGRNQEE